MKQAHPGWANARIWEGSGPVAARGSAAWGPGMRSDGCTTLSIRTTTELWTVRG